MDKVTFIEVENAQYVLIERAPGEFTSMLKSHYDELQKQAEQSTPSVIDEAETK
jgi:hypothetical protein